MEGYYGQKNVPNINIGGIDFAYLKDFWFAFDSDDGVTIRFQTPVLSNEIKEFALSRKIIGETLTLFEEVRRISDSADVIQHLSFLIKTCKFDYVLDAEGIPATYEFTLRCEYHGKNQA